MATKPLLVGTWAAAEKDRLLSTYWCIPDRQRETSVVLVGTIRAPAPS